MTQCNTLNVKLSSSQIDNLKYERKTGTELTLEISSNIVGDSNDENNFPHKISLTNTQVQRLCKAFVNNSEANIELSKTHFHKIGQSGKLLEPLLKTGLPLKKNGLKPLTKSGLIPLGKTAAASGTDAAIYKKMFGSGTTTLIIFNE